MNNKIIEQLLHQEVVPAIGCTEPIAVALCVAKAKETLDCLPEAIEIRLSPNLFKNAMGVGIPNTGMTGLPIAIALGATIGKSELQLEVIRDTTPQAVEQAKRFLTQTDLHISVDYETHEMLYIHTIVRAASHEAKVVISGSHTHIALIELDGKTLYEDNQSSQDKATEEEILTLQSVWDYTTTVPLKDIAFLDVVARVNMAAANLSFTKDCGHGVGKMLHDQANHSIFGDTMFTKILAYTSGACDARMGGEMVTVMSNSGSGNQGIVATNPVVVYAQENGIDHETLLRALALSHLTVIYIKQTLGRLSALCGCVVASIGSCCGLTMLMGGGYEEITYAVKNMVANITGMICDGAKPGCALKVTSGVGTAVLSAVLAMDHRHSGSMEGIVDDDVDQSIHNLTALGKEAMRETDRMILNVMMNKRN